MKGLWGSRNNVLQKEDVPWEQRGVPNPKGTLEQVGLDQGDGHT